jgi:hypothetical protein
MPGKAAVKSFESQFMIELSQLLSFCFNIISCPNCQAKSNNSAFTLMAAFFAVVGVLHQQLFFRLCLQGKNTCNSITSPFSQKLQ